MVTKGSNEEKKSGGGPAANRIICSSVVRSGDTLETALEKISARGFSEIDLIMINGWCHIYPSELATDFSANAKRCEEAFQKYGVTPRAVNVGLTNQPHDRRAGSVRENLKKLEAVFKFMNRFSVKAAALQPKQKDETREPNEVLRDCVDSLAEYYKLAGQYGVSLGLELHVGSPFETKEAVAYLLERLPDAGVAYDPSHFVAYGYDLRESEFFMGNAVQVHLRDAAKDKMQAKLGEGTVDFGWIMNRFAEIGYAGYYSLEYLPSDEADALDEAAGLRDILLQSKSI